MCIRDRTREDLELNLFWMIKNGAGHHALKPLSMTERAVQKLATQNASRVKKPPFKWNHIANGLTGNFANFEELPVMSHEDTKKFLCMVRVLVEREGNRFCKM